MKRIITIILAVLMITSVIVPVATVSASAVSAPSSTAVVSSRISSVMNGTYGTGKYFRDVQSKACYFAGTSTKCHGSHGGSYATNDSYCNCRVATAALAGTVGGIQCFGYARYVFYQAFGVSIGPGIGSGYYQLANYSNANRVGYTTSSTASNTASIFSKARQGDFIQARTKSGGSHSMIVLSVSSSSVKILECNHSGQCYVGTRTIAWSTFASQYPAYTVYTAKNYPGASSVTPAQVTVDTKLQGLFGFLSYPCVGSNFTAYDADLATAIGTIFTTDRCTVNEIYTNGWCKVTYPVSGGTKVGYTQISNFIAGYSSVSPTGWTASANITMYSSSSLSTQIHTIYAGDVCYLMGTSGSATQIFMPITGKSYYSLGWVSTSSLNGVSTPTVPGGSTTPGGNNSAETGRHWMDAFTPIIAYLDGTDRQSVYESDHATVGGQIWPEDKCTINTIYGDIWSIVTYPASGGNKTKEIPLYYFVADPNFGAIDYKATQQTTVYQRRDCSTSIGWVSAGDSFKVIGDTGTAVQVLYPVDATYGGGYKLGWMVKSQLPSTTYTVTFNANGGSGAPAAQTKNVSVPLTLSTQQPTRTGHAFVGWGTSASATTPAYSAGGTYSNDANVTLYAIWRANTSNVVFDANGGIDAPANQTKTYGYILTLSSQQPTRYGYVFQGWGTSATATTAAYQPGSQYGMDADITLYAIWKPTTTTITYDANGGSGAPAPQTKTFEVAINLSTAIPFRAGYTFLGWDEDLDVLPNPEYEAGAEFTIDHDIVLYAVWEESGPVTYTVTFNANGGVDAPAAQTKTHGTDLTLTTAVPTRAGFTFAGWSTSATDGLADYMAGETYAADANVTLYAVWHVEITADTPTMTLSSVSGNPGEMVDVTVTLKNNPGIFSFTLGVAYDDTKMVLTDVVLTDGFGGSIVADNRIVWLADDVDIDTDGVVLTLTFTILDTAEAGSEVAVTLTYADGDICNYDEEDVYFAIVEGTVTIGVTHVPGDVNGDGACNNKDLTRLKRYMSGADVEVFHLDINGDGAENNKDLTRLMKYLSGAEVDIF